MDVKKLFSKKRDIKTNGDDHVKFEWNQIDDNIFLGTNMCCQTHFDEDLLAKGVQLDVSMEEERIDAAMGVKSFLWLPTKDHTAPDIEQLLIGVKAIDEAITSGYKVYIHCKNGHGRAPTMVVAYYTFKGISLEGAIQKVKDKRPETHIEPPQMEALKQCSIKMEKIINLIS